MNEIFMNKYIPVVIPTLNRYNHFRRCLESLERCTLSEYTDVYVGLDYPPSEKYMEGWRKIDEYLKEKERNNKFRHFYVWRRLNNCGVAREGSNASLLLDEVKKINDAYIFSEDDVEFAPNFLVYMNKALNKYKDIPEVVKISAYTDPIFKGITEDSMFCGIDFSAYGAGSWFAKDAFLFKYTNEEISKDLHKSFLQTLRYFLISPALVNSAIHMLVGNHNYSDIRFSMHNLIKGTVIIQPSSSITRNWGADGSGLHSGVVKGMEKNEIQSQNSFELETIPIEVTKRYKKKLYYYRMPKNKIKFLIYWCYDLLYLLCFYFFRK